MRGGAVGTVVRWCDKEGKGQLLRNEVSQPSPGYA